MMQCNLNRILGGEGNDVCEAVQFLWEEGDMKSYISDLRRVSYIADSAE